MVLFFLIYSLVILLAFSFHYSDSLCIGGRFLQCFFININVELKTMFMIMIAIDIFATCNRSLSFVFYLLVSFCNLLNAVIRAHTTAKRSWRKKIETILHIWATQLIVKWWTEMQWWSIGNWIYYSLLVVDCASLSLKLLSYGTGKKSCNRYCSTQFTVDKNWLHLFKSNESYACHSHKYQSGER